MTRDTDRDGNRDRDGDRDRDGARAMGDVAHTNPHTGEAFGANGGVFARGPAASDGGTEGDEMRDVVHAAPDGDGANEVWERGPAAQAESGDVGDAEEPATEPIEGTATDEVKTDGAVSDREEPADE